MTETDSEPLAEDAPLRPTRAETALHGSDPVRVPGATAKTLSIVPLRRSEARPAGSRAPSIRSKTISSR
ncbi:MAG: hypothetical protein HPM95_18075 [Alphaproteobacteria bacterium]|nr:hypothetical protein [Alphaproteobacteria bacterium]